MSSCVFYSCSYKSRPTMFSNTLLFPLDCDPTTAICGRSIGFCTCGISYQSTVLCRVRCLLLTPTVVKTSCSLFTSVIKPGSLTFILLRLSAYAPCLLDAAATHALGLVCAIAGELVCLFRVAICGVRFFALLSGQRILLSQQFSRRKLSTR